MPWLFDNRVIRPVSMECSVQIRRHPFRLCWRGECSWQPLVFTPCRVLLTFREGHPDLEGMAYKVHMFYSFTPVYLFRYSLVTSAV